MTTRPYRLGLIARADDTGLGNQTLEFYRHMKPDKTIVVDMEHLKEDAPTHTDRYPDGNYVVAQPQAPVTLAPEVIDELLQDVDIVFTCEIPYSPLLYVRSERKGVITVCQPNFEFLDQNDPLPTLLAVPTPWHYDDIRTPRKMPLPVPIATDRWPNPGHDGNATNFLHVVGRPAHMDRNGTPDFLNALENHVKSDITVTLASQHVEYIRQLQNVHSFPSNVTIQVAYSKGNYWDLYTGQHVLVQPRRFGGLCLPMQEGLGAGMPVIMTNVSPNDHFLPGEWLVDAIHYDSIGVARNIDVHLADPSKLGALIDRFATDHDFYRESVDQAKKIAQRQSWEALMPVYDQLFTELYESRTP